MQKTFILRNPKKNGEGEVIIASGPFIISFRKGKKGVRMTGWTADKQRLDYDIPDWVLKPAVKKAHTVFEDYEQRAV